MDKTKLLWKLAILFLFITAILVSFETITAGECYLIKLSGSAGGGTQITIDTPTATVPKGSCVIWVNWIIGPSTQLKFEEGKTCKDMTDARTPDWALNIEDNCFVTSFVGEGGTASLVFKNKGIYNYVVETGQGRKANGKIIVE